MSLRIYALTLSQIEEYLDNELNVEKAVVLIDVRSQPDKYIIESKIYSTLFSWILLRHSFLSAGVICGVSKFG